MFYSIAFPLAKFTLANSIASNSSNLIKRTADKADIFSVSEISSEVFSDAEDAMGKSGISKDKAAANKEKAESKTERLLFGNEKTSAMSRKESALKREKKASDLNKISKEKQEKKKIIEKSKELIKQNNEFIKSISSDFKAINEEKDILNTKTASAIKENKYKADSSNIYKDRDAKPVKKVLIGTRNASAEEDENKREVPYPHAKGPSPVLITTSEKAQAPTSIKKLSDMLFKPTVVTKAEMMTKEEAASLIENHNRIKSSVLEISKILEQNLEILEKFKEATALDGSEPEKPKELLKYKVIEVTQRKK
ncbi:hypothetical protein ENBRE01_2243 [Enteropsectra breve]|nr:hypothetical protein ENBRE01_2243 [Enteropsectra breve]